MHLLTPLHSILIEVCWINLHPFWNASHDLNLVFKILQSDRYAKRIEFSPLLNGIGVVFSDGTSGLIICETSKFEPQVCWAHRSSSLELTLYSLQALSMYCHSSNQWRKIMENSLLCSVKCDLSIISIWFDEVIRRDLSREKNIQRFSLVDKGQFIISMN